VRVTILVPPGQNPHAFALRPSQAASLNRAQLLVLNGLGLEFWAEQVISALDNRSIRVLRLGERLGPTVPPGSAPPRDREEGERKPARGAINPHVWLDPVLAMEMVRQVRDALVAADPARAAAYRERADRYLAELAALDADYRQALGDLPARTFIAFHAAYDHLAARYGLTQVAILKGFGDVEPTPARVAEVIHIARRLRVRAIFAEPQFPWRSAQLIAEEAGIGVAILDPLGQSEAATYLGIMRENLRQLVQALR
jgi:ABC-type Zn uptake system ZnuABC Zn-binding protein ZnuA